MIDSGETNVIGIYRVHSVLRYPEYEVVSEKIPRPRVPHHCTVWDIVPACGVDHALDQVRRKHARERHPIVRIYSFNHLGDVTVREDFDYVPAP